MKLDHAIQLSHMKLIHLVYKAKEITLTFQLKSANCFWLYVLILLLLFHQNVWFDFCKFHWLPYSQVWRRGLGQYQKTFKYWKCYICCTSGKYRHLNNLVNISYSCDYLLIRYILNNCLERLQRRLSQHWEWRIQSFSKKWEFSL